MSINLSTVYTTLFDSEVKQAYQAQSTLRNTVRVKTGVRGSSVKFPKIGKGIAHVRIPQTNVTPMNVTYSNVTATITDWNASEYSDIFMQQKVNFDERQELVQVLSKAIGRRLDQLIIDALVAAAAPETVSNDIGGADTGWNVAKLVEAKVLLDENNVPGEDRHLLISARGMGQMLGTTQITSSDYATVKALVQGDVNQFMGFTFHTIGNRDEGGLVVTATDRANFLWQKNAVGLAIGIEPKTSIDWIPEKRSFLVSCDFAAGAVVVDEEGVVEITTRET